MKIILLLFVSSSLIFEISLGSRIHTKFIDQVKEYIDKVTEQESARNAACYKMEDCPNGFYCKNNDCIAKKKELSSCFSGLNEECVCGECRAIAYDWNKVCSSKGDECLKNGITRENSCKRNKDCPNGFFCDQKNEKGLCTSKLASDRACDDDDMCVCGKCLALKYLTRQGMAPITFRACNSCEEK